MAIKTIFSFLSLSVLLSFPLSAQRLLIGNGGTFGSSTDFTNLGIYDAQDNSFVSIDTVRNNSIQDLLIESDRFAYLATEDSIVKYDLWTRERIAIGPFGASSTIRLGIYQDKLLVGNWYGAAQGNLRIFDKNTLAYLDSIPEISKGATDFLIIDNKAYIAQNNVNGSWSDTLGYIAVVDLDNHSFLHNDTLSTVGDEIGRLVNVGDTMLYTINGVSSTISSLHLNSGAKQTVAAAAVLNPRTTGASIFYDGTAWYLPFGNGIGSYDLVNNSVISSDIVSIPMGFSFAFAVDTLMDYIYVSHISFSNQSDNKGFRYNLAGDSLGTFPVGSSPEVLTVWNSAIALGTSNLLSNDFSFSAYPNPCQEQLNIRSKNALQQVAIFDMNGRLLLSKEIYGISEIQLNTASLPKGFYLVNIIDSTGRTQTQRFIKG